MYPNIYMIFSWNILSVGFTYIYIGFLYVQWITISENKWNSTISPNLMLKNAKHIYMMFCWNILSVGVMYIYIGFLYVSWFTISNEEWTLTFQVVILYGFILYGLYVYMCIYIQIYANKPCLCEAFYIKTMVFLCGDMQALLISERQNQKLYWQSHSVEAFQGYTILVYGIFYLFSFRLTFIKII